MVIKVTVPRTVLIFINRIILNIVIKLLIRITVIVVIFLKISTTVGIVLFAMTVRVVMIVFFVLISEVKNTVLITNNILQKNMNKKNEKSLFLIIFPSYKRDGMKCCQR